MPLRVLCIDDDDRLHALLGDYLRQNDVTLVSAPDGPRGLKTLAGGGFDAVFLDVMMPGMDGLEVLRRIRERSTIPVIMLTARGDETDRVVGLELGADDYLPKPFGARELLARLRAVLRRGAAASAEQIKVGDLSVDVPGHEVRVRGKPVSLTGLEFDLLVALVRRAGRVVPRDALLDEAGRGDTVVGDRAVDVPVSHLRQKLGDDSRAPRIIKTVRGVGYLLVKP